MGITPGSALALYDYLTSIWYFVYKNCSHVQTFGLLWWLCLKLYQMLLLPQSYLLNCTLQWLHIESYSVQRTLYRDFSWDYKRKKLVVSRSRQRYIRPHSVTCRRNRSKKCALMPTSPWDEIPVMSWVSCFSYSSNRLLLVSVLLTHHFPRGSHTSTNLGWRDDPVG